MSPIEQIKKGILTQDWTLIKIAYTSLTGDSLDGASVPTDESESEDKSIHQMFALTREDQNEIDRMLNKVPKITETSGAVNAKDRTPVCISTAEDKSKLKENETLASTTNKQTRKGYKPQMRTCGTCSKKYDLGKLVRVENDIVRCPKCNTVEEL